ncbi:MAG: response regulator transcription factor [Clostridia bacterium]|nr:response regulator transcription factor [Clostridia bacterium]
MHKILILEDDIEFAEIMSIYLKSKGYKSVHAKSIAEAVEAFNLEHFDLIISDIMLPDGFGTNFCKHIRTISKLPIIVISCLGDDTTIVEAFSNGADDYITKPLNPVQFLARVEANIRRDKEYGNYNSSSALNGENYVMFCGMKLDDIRRSITYADGTSVDLSPIEYTVLKVFLKNPGVLLLYDKLYKEVWDRDSLGDYRSIMVHVSNLKKKIDPFNSGIITNTRGAGYIYTPK